MLSKRKPYLISLEADGRLSLDRQVITKDELTAFFIGRNAKPDVAEIVHALETGAEISNAPIRVVVDADDKPNPFDGPDGSKT